MISQFIELYELLTLSSISQRVCEAEPLSLSESTSVTYLDPRNTCDDANCEGKLPRLEFGSRPESKFDHTFTAPEGRLELRQPRIVISKPPARFPSRSKSSILGSNIGSTLVNIFPWLSNVAAVFLPLRRRRPFIFASGGVKKKVSSRTSPSANSLSHLDHLCLPLICARRRSERKMFARVDKARGGPSRRCGGA